MKIIDASGPIYQGMWSYGEPFPEFKPIEIMNPEKKTGNIYAQKFEGLSILTGTCMESPSLLFGTDKSYPLSSIPLEKFFEIDGYVLKFDLVKLPKKGNRPYISMEHIKRVEPDIIPDGAVIITATGWGKHWSHADFQSHNWFFKKDAVEYLVSKKPFILAGDTPAYDNNDESEDHLKLIYENDILILGPLVNLEKITGFKVKLYIFPINILNTTGLPCRVLIKEE